MTDVDFLQQFERCELAPEHFDHRGHLRLAVLYLTQYSLPVAIDKITTGIARYAASLGAADKFHHTLTEATVRIIWLRIQRQETPDFNSFLKQNTDLAEDLQSAIFLHYSHTCLDSPQAKKQFMEPDIKPFETEQLDASG